MHNKVLIANRGEIAIRIARAATALGMESVAVYAPIDELSLHTRLTTSARPLGAEMDPVAAYLDMEQLVAIALAEGCDCVHPGYGFLAENARFAELCETAGVRFVGPPPAALELFGNKLSARELAGSLGIPLVAGSGNAPAALQEALAQADELGYPVVFKAAAGGGGRGMRVAAKEDELAVAFERARSEAAAAFGDGTVFLERYLTNPRHIEVQILADGEGNVVHLHERDCSVQRNHQKVVEIAPAPALPERLRERVLADAVTLARGASYENAGTVEFLVDPEAGAHYFIECNPRIQVEHTITEQITGVDLVAVQFRLAAGATLAELGLADQAAVGAPRGFSVQARVVARGAGRITAYREPSGAGVRVDGCGYLGYEPAPQFDPLLAKVICSSTAVREREGAGPEARGPNAGSPEDGGPEAGYTAAVDLTLQALDEFQISGFQTNLAELRAILLQPAFRAGNARTSLLDSTLEPAADVAGPGARALALLDEQAAALVDPRATTPRPQAGLVLAAATGQLAVQCPLQSSIVECHVAAGDRVIRGEPLLVVSAMKMETEIIAPCAGEVAALLPLNTGDLLSEGQVVAVLTPADGDDDRADRPAAGPWEETLNAVATLRSLGEARLAAGSEEPGVVRQRSRGKLTCRERIQLLLDEDSFREVGSVAGFASYEEDGAIAAFTPANSVGGWGRIEERPVVVCADDFTSRGGHADGAIGAKSGYLDRVALEMLTPSLRLLDGSSGGGSVAAMVPEQKKAGDSRAQESAGAIKAGRPRVAGGGGSFLPGHLGSSMYAEQLATIPVVNLLLGSVVGIGAAKAVLGHFSVMVRDIAQLFVAGPPVVAHAMGYDITKEELGGWHIHCANGSVDNLADSEAEAAAMARRFLSYLPSSVYEAPPVISSSDPVDRREEELASLIARKRTTTFDMRRVITLIADEGSFFELGPLWGTDQITGFVRCNGHPLGVIASDSRHVNGGALTADGCDKLKRHLDLCDLFHVPVLNLVDNPGFAVGLEHEIAGTIRKGGEWMVAFAQVGIPIFTVLVRRSFGVAGNNYATPRSKPSMRVAWPAVDVGGIPPEGGIEAAYKRQLAEAEDPAALRAELNARIESARGPVGPLNRFQVEEMIDPRDTRRLICEWVEVAYRVVSQPARLVPRPLQFRP